MVFGEITTRAKVDYEAIVRKTCRDIGFISDDVGLDADKCKVRGCCGCWAGAGPAGGCRRAQRRACRSWRAHPHCAHPSQQASSRLHGSSRPRPPQVLVHIEEQSPDIGQGVHGMGTKTLEEIGAGDQVRSPGPALAAPGVRVCGAGH